jgi:hypothetical protein
MPAAPLARARRSARTLRRCAIAHRARATSRSERDPVFVETRKFALISSSAPARAPIATIAARAPRPCGAGPTFAVPCRWGICNEGRRARRGNKE